MFALGCGGGTYGTGGSHTNSTAILRSSLSGLPVEGATLQGVGSSETFISNKDGLVTLPLNENFPLSPIRVKLFDGNEMYTYVATDKAIKTKEPIVLEVSPTESGMTETTAVGIKDTCSAQLDSWMAGISSQDESGLSHDQISAIADTAEDTALDCQEKLLRIVQIAFAPI